MSRIERDLYIKRQLNIFFSHSHMCFLISYYFWRMSLIVCAERRCAEDESRYEGGAYLRKIFFRKLDKKSLIIYIKIHIYMTKKKSINVVNQALCS